MNPRVLLIVAISAAIAVSAYLFFGGETAVNTLHLNPTAGGTSLGSGKSRATDDATENPPAGNVRAPTGKTPSVNWERFGALMGSGTGGDPFPEISTADVERFLAKRGSTAANLIAAFERTHDRRLLDRALELFPNSALVLLAAVDSIPSGNPAKAGEPYIPDARRMACIDRFKAADPNNPLPWIFSAQALFKSGQSEDAIADLRSALKRPAFYTYGNERMDSMQALLEGQGLSPVEASLLAIAGLTLPHMSAAQQTSRSLMEWQKAAADSGDATAAAEAIELTYRLGRTFATPEASRTLIGQLVGVSMEARALKALPPGTQPGWLNVWPEIRLAEMESQKQNVKDLTTDFEWVIQSQNEPLLTEYLRRNRNDGELSALTWLRKQTK